MGNTSDWRLHLITSTNFEVYNDQWGIKQWHEKFEKTDEIFYLRIENIYYRESIRVNP